MSSRSASPCPSDSECGTEYTDSLVYTTVSFPECKWDGTCRSFEAFAIDPLDDTVSKVIHMIAKRFKIEENEFVFYGRGKKPCHEYDPETIFAKVFYSETSIARLKAGAPIMPLRIKLYANPEYKGETGMLRQLLDLEEFPSNIVFSGDGEDDDGDLASLFEDISAALKAQQEVPTEPEVSEDVVSVTTADAQPSPVASHDEDSSSTTSERRRSADTTLRTTLCKRVKAGTKGAKRLRPWKKAVLKLYKSHARGKAE
ncbi:hypothetical protein GGH94_002208 [Coemansia aciculifera]|uniref:Uncharacterized protein n=1 Tax=Coemansia aciculifera TaxID=417176 RepID=A0A9W8ISS3_9FUNG|nr:hypothetical protein GGH94_002208 [Coemansia aciculifera]KAJ2875171.1 hypothetical protein GGH93_001797 [Coemansia aciculifera]